MLPRVERRCVKGAVSADPTSLGCAALSSAAHVGRGPQRPAAGPALPRAYERCQVSELQAPLRDRTWPGSSLV
jgi:hypothetical protein